MGIEKRPTLEALFYTHDPIAWLSELYNERQYINLAIQNLEMAMVPA